MKTIFDLHNVLRHPLLILLVLTLVSANATPTSTVNLSDGPSAIEIVRGTVTTVVADICDNYGFFNCPIGTCYTGYDGFVGCCSAASCAARKECFSYDSKVSRSCNVDTDGCIACSSEAPACVTESNIVNHQYIMYCDTNAALVTLSYTNLFTMGSMALPPISNTASVAPLTACTLSPSSSDAEILAPDCTPTTVAIAPNVSQTSDIQLSRGALAGIIVGSVVGLTLIMLLVGFLYRRRRIFVEARYAKSERSPGLFDLNNPNGVPTDMVTPRRLQKPPTPRAGYVRDRVGVYSDGDNYSISVGELLARNAEHRTTSGFLHGISRSDYSPSATLPPTPAVNRTRSCSHSPLHPQRSCHNSSGVVERGIAELPSFSIHPPGAPDLPPVLTTNFDRDPHSLQYIDASSSIYSDHNSPDPNSFVGAPITSPPTTPLMGRWVSDRSSVGQDTTRDGIPQTQSERLSGFQSSINGGIANRAAAHQTQTENQDRYRAQDGVSARVSGPLDWPSSIHMQTPRDSQPRRSRSYAASPNSSMAMTGNRRGRMSSSLRGNRDSSPMVGTLNTPSRSLRGDDVRPWTNATGFSRSGHEGYVTAEAAMTGVNLGPGMENAF